MKKQIAGIVLMFMSLGYYGFGSHTPGELFSQEEEDLLPANAPAGAIEFFETSDGKSSITLYEDSIAISGDAVGADGDFSIPINQIVYFKRKPGNYFRIEGKDGSWIEFNLGVFGRKAALRFEETMNELFMEQPLQQ